VRAPTILAPKLSLFSPGLKVPVENIEMSTHLLSKQRRTHNERKETLEILSLRKNSRCAIISRLDMKFMQTSNGKHGRALPREQALVVFLCLLISICFLRAGRGVSPLLLRRT
jgi:hypothetical protein